MGADGVLKTLVVSHRRLPGRENSPLPSGFEWWIVGRERTITPVFVTGGTMTLDRDHADRSSLLLAGDHGPRSRKTDVGATCGRLCRHFRPGAGGDVHRARRGACRGEWGRRALALSGRNDVTAGGRGASRRRPVVGRGYHAPPRHPAPASCRGRMVAGVVSLRDLFAAVEAILRLDPRGAAAAREVLAAARS